MLPSGPSGAPVKFVHAADLHLDSPLRGLDRYEGAPVDELRGATRRALGNLVTLCLDERADFLLIAGDLYDGTWRDYKTGLFFAAQMSRLREASIPVFLVSGNHDAESHVGRALKLPDNVHELGTKAPVTDDATLAHLGVAIHGQGFAHKAVTADLAAGYPDRLPDRFNIGLLHTSLDGREGHAPYAPCTVATLAGKGYDYWALGHVHRREVICEAPWIVFPGNLQGRHAKETGEKGATLVTVEEGRVAVEARALDVVRWAAIEVDAATAAGAEEVVERAREALAKAVARAEGRTVAARVTVVGTSAAHGALSGSPERWESELRAAATDVGGVWLERVRFATRTPLDLPRLAERDDPIGALLRSLGGLRGDEAALRELGRELGEMARLPHELREGDDAVLRDDPEALRALVDDVEQLLLPRLLGGERAP